MKLSYQSREGLNHIVVTVCRAVNQISYKGLMLSNAVTSIIRGTIKIILPGYMPKAT